MKIFAIALAIIMIIATLIPFLRHEYWWIRVFDFPRLQILGLAVISLIFYLFYWDAAVVWESIFLVILLAAIFYQISVIFPYTPLSKKQVVHCKEPFESISFGLQVMNVYMYNRNNKKASDIIIKQDPDILIMLETDEWWKNRMSFLEESHPHNVLIPLENTYGMLLYSKFPLIEPTIKYMLVPEVPSIHTRIKIDDAEITLHAMHPEPPAPGHSYKSTKRDAELIMIGKETRNSQDPVIVAGDLNDVAWSYTTRLFQQYSELMDPRIGRGMFNTFNANHFLMRWPLDHIFHSDHFQLVDIKLLEGYGSDHFPIFVKLCFRPDKRHKQSEPEADKEEAELAEDKVERANNSQS